MSGSTDVGEGGMNGMSGSASNVNSDDARDFVEAVMSSQLVNTVGTPAESSKKRPANSPLEIDDTNVKKQRNSVRRTLDELDELDGLDDGSPVLTPRRDPHEVGITEAQIHADGNATVEYLIKKMSADMHTLFGSLSERMDKLESSLEQRISNKVSQLLDKRVNAELSRIRRDVDQKISDLKESVIEDVSGEFSELKATVDRIAVTRSDSSDSDIGRNIIIRGLSESGNENVVSRVNNLFKDGLKIRDVKCESAERKESSNRSKPGVIVVRMVNMDEKRRVMARKSDLKNCRQYDKVFIDHDASYADRVMSNNFRAVLKVLKSQNLIMKGSRVVYSNGVSSDNDANFRESDADRNGGNRGGNVESRWQTTDRHGRHGNQPRGNGNGNRGNFRGGRRDNSRPY